MCPSEQVIRDKSLTGVQKECTIIYNLTPITIYIVTRMLFSTFLGYHLPLMCTGELKRLYGIKANLNQQLLLPNYYKEQRKNKEIL